MQGPHRGDADGGAQEKAIRLAADRCHDYFFGNVSWSVQETIRAATNIDATTFFGDVSWSTEIRAATIVCFDHAIGKHSRLRLPHVTK